MQMWKSAVVGELCNHGQLRQCALCLRFGVLSYYVKVATDEHSFCVPMRRDS